MKSNQKYQKMSIYLLIACLMLSSFTQASVVDSTGSCYHKCAECKREGELKWCSKCYESEHYFTNATNGRCKGDSSPLVGCLVSESKPGQHHSCVKCKTGYQLFPEISSEILKIWTCSKFKDPNALSSTVNEDGELIITSCKYGFIPEGDKCKEVNPKDLIFIPNCVAFEGIKKCSKCKSGYFLSRYNTNINHCQKEIHHTPGCKTFSYLIDSKYCSKGCDWENGYYSVEGFSTITFQVSAQLCYNPSTKHYANEIEAVPQ